MAPQLAASQRRRRASIPASSQSSTMILAGKREVGWTAAPPVIISPTPDRARSS